MKQIAALLFILLFAFSCKKKDSSSGAQEQTVAAPDNGTLNITINSYDSLGQLETKIYNTKIFVSGATYSATTDSNGKASFNVPPSTYLPSVIRSGYEGVPFSANVTSNNTTQATSFIAMNSPYALHISSGSAVNQDSVTLSFTLNKSIPAGKLVKMAVLFGTNSSLSVNSYTVFGEFNLWQSSYTTFNICSGALKTAINQLPASSSFFLIAVPVTYGNYFSNVLNKNILVGDNLPTAGVPTSSLQLTKSW